MKDRSKKYLKMREDDHPPLGNFVHWFIKKQNVLKKNVAKELEIVPITLNQYFKQNSLRFGIIWRISKAINYNMVMDLGERLNIEYETKTEKKLKTELPERDELIREMKIQMRLYEKIINGKES